MKFYKTLKLNRTSAKSLDLTYKTDGQIIMDSINPEIILRALRIPTGTGDPAYTPGTPQNQRPLIPYDSSGLLRYNTSLKALEVYSFNKWIQLRAKEPANIVQQTFTPPPVAGYDPTQTYVDGIETYFGPLIGPGGLPPDSERAFFCYIENVFQIPGTNYTMVESTQFSGSNPPYPTGLYLSFTEPPPLGKNITVLHGFD